MRVLMAVRALPMHGAGGMESATLDLARALRDLGAQVELLTTGKAGLAARDEIDGVPVRCLPSASGRYSQAWWRGSAARPLEDYDVVLGVSAAANAMARRRRRPGGPAFVFQAHGTALGEVRSKLRRPSARAVVGAARNLAWFAIKDRAYRDYDAVVAVGETVARQLAAWPTRALLGSTPTRLIRNGVDAGAFRFRADLRAAARRSLGLRAEDRVAVVLGRLHVQKGVDVALDAFAAAAPMADDLRLVIVGEGPDRAALERRAQTLGVAARVRFAGEIVRLRIVDHLCAADLLLFPSRRVEGLPLCVLEALACGLPILTAEAALPDLRLPATRVRGGAEAFGSALRRLGPPPAVRASRLPGEFTLEHSAAAYLALFDGLSTAAAGPGRRAS